MVNSQDQKQTLNIKPKWVLAALGGFEITVLVFSVLGQYLKLYPDSISIISDLQAGLVRNFIVLFDVNSESNITTFFSVSMALSSAFLLLVIAYFKFTAKDKYRVYWAVLAFFVLYISMDDAAVIHEKVSKYLKGFSSMGGWFAYKWVIIGLIVVAVFGLLFFRFWLNLDNKYKVLFLVSAALFFGGAMGVEMIGGHWQDSFGSKNFIYVWISTIEQGLQYFGLAFLVYSLLLYIKDYFPEFSVSAKEPAKGE